MIQKKVCYFNKPGDDELYNVFISNGIKTENFSNNIYVRIDRVQCKDKTFDVEKTLKQDGTHDRFSKFDKDPEPEFNGRGRVRKRGYEEILSTLREGLESQLDLDFLQDDNDVQKKAETTTKYSNTKVKTKNLLTNVSYRRYKPDDIEKKTFLSLFFRF